MFKLKVSGNKNYKIFGPNRDEVGVGIFHIA
jgi:hypothetical protein